MVMPKGFKKNIKLTRKKVGVERRQELLDNIAEKGTFLPKGVLYEDMDRDFIDFIDKGLEIVIEGEKVPVIFLTIQRWAEFSATWQFTDEFKNIKIPFITVVRKPDIQVGTNQAGNFNIPGRRTYTYYKVPTFDGNRKGIDTYKIPQPTAVDITYEVRLFCNKMRDLNKLHLQVHKTFQSRQHYIFVNQHPMPVTLENVGDESNIDSFEDRRFYVQSYEMKLAGYILDEEDFEVINTVNRAAVFQEVYDTVVEPTNKITKYKNTIEYEITFKPNSQPTFSTRVTKDIVFTEVFGITNITSIEIKVNNIIVTEPFSVVVGDIITFTVVKNNLTTGKFKIKGNV